MSSATTNWEDLIAIRIAAVGDVHFGTDAAGSLAPAYRQLNEQADLLLIAGDITITGHPFEAAAFIEELRELEIPKIAVLGNHEYHLDREQEIRDYLQRSGYTVLEGDYAELEVNGTRVGVAGTVGFGGGLDWDTTGVEFGEPEMRAFMRRNKETANRLQKALAELRSDIKIALTHYAPTRDTVLGERLELYPYLGSYLLGNAVDFGGAQLAIHGHAHGGRETGFTPAGVPVRNVAMPVIKAPYRLFSVSDSGRFEVVAPQA